MAQAMHKDRHVRVHCGIKGVGDKPMHHGLIGKLLAQWLRELVEDQQTAAVHRVMLLLCLVFQEFRDAQLKLSSDAPLLHISPQQPELLHVRTPQVLQVGHGGRDVPHDGGEGHLIAKS